MSRLHITPFHCFCFAVFLLCIPMSYEFGSSHFTAPAAVHHKTPVLARVEADAEPPWIRVPAASRRPETALAEGPAPAPIAMVATPRVSQAFVSGPRPFDATQIHAPMNPSTPPPSLDSLASTRHIVQVQ